MAENRKESGTDFQKNLYRDLLIIVAALGTVAIVYTVFHVSKAASTTAPAKQTESAPKQVDFGNATVEQLVSTGNQLMDSGRYPEAIMHYSAALDKDPSLVDVCVDRGSCYFATEQYDKAIDDFQAALKLDKDHAIAHFNLGITYHTMGQDSLSVVYWKRFLELNPDSELASKVREVLDQISN